MTESVMICAETDLAENVVKSVDLSVEGYETGVIVLRKDGRIHAFENRCPHMWAPLDGVGESVLLDGGQLLQCSFHFAQFRVSDGLCVYGPCQGQSLRVLEVECLNGIIFWRNPG